MSEPQLVSSILFGGAVLLGSIGIGAELIDKESSPSLAAQHLTAAYRDLNPVQVETFNVDGRDLTLSTDGIPNITAAKPELSLARDLTPVELRKKCLEQVIRAEIVSREAASRCILKQLRGLEDQKDSEPLIPKNHWISAGLVMGALGVAALVAESGDSDSK